MAELKTQPTTASVADFLDAIENDQVRQDCWEILNMMQAATQSEPVMWGDSIVGFGIYHYVYASGRQGDWMLTAFSPRKRDITLYIMTGFEKFEGLLTKLGKYSTGKSCLYIKRLSDIDKPTLNKLIQESVNHLRKSNLQEGKLDAT